MEILPLEVQSRDVTLNAFSIRKEGLIPAVFYGLKQKNRHLVLDYQTFRRVYEKAGGNTVLELNVDGKDKTNVLVHKVDYDPVTDKFIHVDFIFVNLDKEVTTEVPLIATGESKAVREMEGTLMQNRDTLTVKCIARNIPKNIEFDISGIEDFQTSIHIKDLILPEGVTAVDEGELTIATVAPPKVEEEAPPEEEEVEEGEEVEGEVKEGEVKEEEVKEGEEAAKEGKEEAEGEAKKEGGKGKGGEKGGKKE